MDKPGVAPTGLVSVSYSFPSAYALG